MENVTVTERIAQAHQRAVHSLVLYLERLQNLDPDRLQVREYYCNCLRNEAFKNANGEKEYDEDFLHQLIPTLLAEYQSKELDSYIEEEIMAYRQAMMTREILNNSVNAILSSKFSKKVVDNYTIMCYSEDRIIITRHKRYSDVSVEMNYESLLEKVRNASKIKDLFKE